jgi:hypothetical protein
MVVTSPNGPICKPSARDVCPDLPPHCPIETHHVLYNHPMIPYTG